MANPKTRLLAVGTATCAFAIGYVMQFGMPFTSGPTGPIEVSGIVDTAAPTDADAGAAAPRDPRNAAMPALAGTGLPAMPRDTAAAADLPDDVIEVAAIDGATASDATLPSEAAGAGFDCDISATAEPSAGALVSLSVTAPCHGSERLTVHHSGLMFTATMQPDGRLALEVPALSEQAVFILSYASGDGAVAQTQVSSLAFYDRVALQWRGQGGLQLHAREMGADYFAEGHIWSGARGSIEAAARGEGGFLTRLGDADAPEPLLAEVYSFPAGTARVDGDIALTVEAEITATNCADDVAAQTLDRRRDAQLTVQDLTLSMPECDAVGDFLVLDGMVRDIEVAAR